ncbi:MAG: hypothetical protein RR482_04755 [Clostridia bacterium]
MKRTRRIGFIDYYLDEWHANNYPAWLRAATDGEVIVTHAYGQLDSPKGGRTNAQWCTEMGITCCATVSEVIAACDGLIVLSPDNCEMHEALCQEPLRSGKPVYVDKTFAPDLATARRIFALADASQTPCYSTSALRYAAEYAGLERADIRAISSVGAGVFEMYVIHQLEPILMLINAPAKRVMCMRNDGWTGMNIAFADGRYAMLACFETGAPFALRLCLPNESLALQAESDFFKAFIARLAVFFQDGIPAVSHEETLRIMAVRGAGVRALETPGAWVDVDE